MTYHTPVLLPYVIEGLHIHAGQWYIDATLGGGGYAVEILKAGGKVIGIDTDQEAIDYARERIRNELPTSTEHTDWIVVHENFRTIETVVANAGLDHVAGVLFDLGVSSHQLDTAGRGMSFRYPNEPFDLRLNQQQGETAAELVNRLSREELYEIIATYGEEELAGAISAHLYRARSIKPFATVGDIISNVEQSTGLKNNERVLARVFQAFRIAVNDELGALKSGLAGAERVLETNGRLVVISFHSLEDRIVKQFLRNHSFRIITKDIRRADEIERMENRRSRSAKLRIGEKL